MGSDRCGADKEIKVDPGGAALDLDQLAIKPPLAHQGRRIEALPQDDERVFDLLLVRIRSPVGAAPAVGNKVTATILSPYTPRPGL